LLFTLLEMFETCPGSPSSSRVKWPYCPLGRHCHSSAFPI
jgi:hypothetical protein